MYVVYILVVCFGRFINQKLKKMTGRFVQKNDFSSERINQDPSDQDSTEANLTKPLLNQTIDDEPEQLTLKKAIYKAVFPIDFNEWNESNIFFKLMLIIKLPVNLILKITIPLIDYEIKNHNWNKVTITINCLTAPMFVVFATKSFK